MMKNVELKIGGSGREREGQVWRLARSDLRDGRWPPLVHGGDTGSGRCSELESRYKIHHSHQTPTDSGVASKYDEGAQSLASDKPFSLKSRV